MDGANAPLRWAGTAWILVSAGAVVVIAAVSGMALWGRSLEPGGARPAAGLIAAPDRWSCEMSCEGGKAYTGRGVCPVCRMNLTRPTDRPFAVTVAALTSLVPGKDARLRVTALDPDGKPVREFDGESGRPLVCWVVSEDLSWFAVEQPERREDGSFDVGAVFPSAGRFALFADFRPRDRARQIPSQPFRVAGVAPAPVAPAEDFDRVMTTDGYEFRIRCNGSKYFAGGASFMRFGVDRAMVAVGDLEPIGGELGRLLVLHAGPLSPRAIAAHVVDVRPFLSDKPDDPAAAVHVHGLANGRVHPLSLKNGKPTDVAFETEFPEPGMYRLLAVFRHEGRLKSVGFWINAQPAEPASGPGAAE